MIYAQIRAVPRWSHWTTPVVFLAFSLTGGAIMAAAGLLTVVLCAALLMALIANYVLGDRQFAERGASMGTATGLGRLGAMKVFEQPHTGDNYLLREMIFVVGRKHADKLRLIALAFAVVVPGVMVALIPGSVIVAVAAVTVHLAGAFAARWLFFAQAEHVVGLYYGKR
jgi:DMSO reductase anchor subunit